MVKSSVKYKTFLFIIAVFLFSGHSYAFMGAPNGYGGMGMNNGVNSGMGMNGGGGTGMFGGGHMASNRVGFGMMTGMTGAPVVGDDGTAYFVGYVKAANSGKTPNGNSFQSSVTAFDLTGQSVSLTLKGIVSRPVIAGNNLIATASLPDMSGLTITMDYSTGPASGQSVIYVFSLPLSASAEPAAISLDGGFASVPVIAGSHIYVTTSDYGNAMMGDGAFNSAYGNYNFNKNGSAKTYLYIFNMDWTLASKIPVQ